MSDAILVQEVLLKYFGTRTRIASVVKARKALADGPSNGCEPIDLDALANMLDFAIKQAWNKLSKIQKQYWIGRMAFDLQLGFSNLLSKKGN